MWVLLAELRGVRRALLTLALLFFVIILLEVDLGHREAIGHHDAWAVLVPVVWVPVSILALMALQLWPCLASAILVVIAMAVGAAVGMIGSGLHMMAAGVDLEHLSRAFSPAVWSGPVSPNWPISITMASFLGFLAALGGEREGFPGGVTGIAAGAAYVLILIGIVVFAVTPAWVMVSMVSLVAGALLLVAVLSAIAADVRMKRIAR